MLKSLQNLSLIIGFLSLSFFLHAEIPQNYYSSATGKSGSSLKSTLSKIIYTSNVVSYDGLWELYKSSDVRDDGKVWDIYSSATNYIFGRNQCGNYSGEGSCYNREHTVPKSWFSKQAPMVSDAHHLLPTDGQINSYRGNYPFGEVGSNYKSSKNNFSKWGTSNTSGISGTVFEPNDQYKGDIARIYFYMATAYESKCGSWQSGVFSSTYPNLATPTLNLMLKWHRMDPVSDKEIKRNDAIYKSSQKNRNPYVDYPELVDLIFGDKRNVAFDPSNTGTALPPLTEERKQEIITYMQDETLHIVGAPHHAVVHIFSMTGNLIKQIRIIENDEILTLDKRGVYLIQISHPSLEISRKIGY